MGELQFYIITLPGVGEEVGEGELLVLQVHHGDQEALDEVPGLPPRKVVRGATLEGGQGKVHRLWENKASWEIPKPRHHGYYQTAIYMGNTKQHYIMGNTK